MRSYPAPIEASIIYLADPYLTPYVIVVWHRYRRHTDGPPDPSSANAGGDDGLRIAIVDIDIHHGNGEKHTLPACPRSSPTATR